MMFNSLKFNTNDYSKKIKWISFFIMACLVFNASFLTKNLMAMSVQLMLVVVIYLYYLWVQTIVKGIKTESTSKNIDLQHHDVLSTISPKEVFFNIGDKKFHLAKREKTPLSLIYLVIEPSYSNNKQIQEELKELTVITISNSIRKSDLFTQVESMTFAILLINTNKGGAKLFSEVIKEEIEKISIYYNNKEIDILAHVFLSTLNANDTSFQSLFNQTQDKGHL